MCKYEITLWYKSLLFKDVSDPRQHQGDTPRPQTEPPESVENQREKNADAKQRLTILHV